METSQPNNIYIPPGAIPLDKVDQKFQLRLGIQGPPKWGKTWGALTFPNPVVLSYDRGLVSHVGRSDVIEIPFYNPAFVDGICPRGGIEFTDFNTQQKKIRPPNRKDALVKWLSTEALKLTANQTLILDGNTGIEASFHIQYWVDPPVGKDGILNKYTEWRWKIDFFTEIAMALKSLACDVILISHESPDRNEKGDLNGMVRPLITGQFQDQIQSHFTDWFRSRVVSKPSSKDLHEKFMTDWKIDAATLKEWIESTPPEHQTIYLWQTSSDSICSCGTSLVNNPKYILANHKSFSKYKRQNKTS